MKQCNQKKPSYLQEHERSRKKTGSVYFAEIILFGATMITVLLFMRAVAWSIDKGQQELKRFSLSRERIIHSP